MKDIKNIRILGYDEKNRANVLVLDEEDERVMCYGTFDFDNEEFEGEYVVDESYVAQKLSEMDWTNIKLKSKKKKLKSTKQTN